MNSYTIKTSKSNTTVDATASFQEIELSPSVKYFITSKLQISFIYHQSLVGEYDINGPGAGVHYYFIGGKSHFSQKSQFSIQTIPVWSFYSGFIYNNISVGGGTLDVKFNHLQIGGGAERAIFENHFLTLSAYYGILQSSTIREGNSFGLSLGIVRMF